MRMRKRRSGVRAAGCRSAPGVTRSDPLPAAPVVDSPADATLPATEPGLSDESSQARALLQESVAKAAERLRWSRCRQGGPPAAEQDLRSAVSAAHQLMANPDARTDDLLRCLADVEAGVQILAVPIDVEMVRGDLDRLQACASRLRCLNDRLGLLGSANETSRDDDAAALAAEAAELRSRLGKELAQPCGQVSQKLAGDFEAICAQLDGLASSPVRSRSRSPNPAAGAASSPLSGSPCRATSPRGRSLSPAAGAASPLSASSCQPASPGGGRTVGAHLREIVMDHEVEEEIEMTTSIASSSTMHLSMLELEEWDDAHQTDEVRRLGQLAADAEALAEAQRRVAQLTAEAAEPLEVIETNMHNAVVETAGAVHELAVASQRNAKNWALYSSLGGAAVGAVVGACVSGPIGAAVGAGASAALFGVGGTAATHHYNSELGIVLASCPHRANA